jgi:hypothetical protein
MELTQGAVEYHATTERPAVELAAAGRTDR